MIRKNITALVISLLFILIILPPAISLYNIWKELSIAESVLTFHEDKSSSNRVIARVIGNNHIHFAINPKTIFFLYKREEGVIRIGYYWRNLSILEKKLNIPFVGSNFEKIPTNIFIEETPSHKDALDKLDRLKEFPLSLFDKLSLLFDTYSFDNRI